MDSTIALIIVGFFALVSIVAFMRFRQNVSAKLKGPFGTRFHLKGTNQQSTQPAIDAKNVTSRRGGISMDDFTGQGVKADNIEAENNIQLSSRRTFSDPKE